jgi:phosphate starvation-inducible membrane PsiE
MIEKIKLKVENLREILKFLLLLMLAILTGEVTLVYKIFLKEVGVWFIFFVFIGLVLIYFNLMAIKFVWNLMEEEIRSVDE